MADAHCTQSDPEAWYPEVGSSPRPAKKICLGCPSIAPCLQWALDHDEKWGVWGGTSYMDRRRLKAAEAQAAAA
jgi:WhiB family redox-sensing transcriptional regulator